MPFNRAERSWVYRAAKGEDTMVAFGSTRDMRPVGSVIFVNCPYPTLEQDAVDTTDVTIGPSCEKPYTTSSVFHISAMSYGAVSRPAVTALSNGARMAGVWMNTGEGGLSPTHLEGGADIVFQFGTAKYGVRDVDGRTLGRAFARGRRARAGEDVRDQAVSRRQAGQGRHPSRREGDRRGRRHPAHRCRAGLHQSQPAPGDQLGIGPSRHDRPRAAGDGQANRLQDGDRRLRLDRRPVRRDPSPRHRVRAGFHHRG